MRPRGRAPLIRWPEHRYDQALHRIRWDVDPKPVLVTKLDQSAVGDGLKVGADHRNMPAVDVSDMSQLRNVRPRLAHEVDELHAAKANRRGVVLACLDRDPSGASCPFRLDFLPRWRDTS